MEKVNAVLRKIETNDITTINNLFYADAALENDLIGVKKDRAAKK